MRLPSHRQACSRTGLPQARDPPVPRHGLGTPGRIDPKADYGALGGLARNRINTDLIAANWEDLLRVAGTLATGKVKVSDFLRTLQGSYYVVLRPSAHDGVSVRKPSNLVFITRLRRCKPAASVPRRWFVEGNAGRRDDLATEGW